MKNLIFAISLIMSGMFNVGCYYDNKEDLNQYLVQETCVVADASYVSEVLPILATHCLSCHNPNNAKGGVDLEGHTKAQNSALDGSLMGTINFEPGWSIMPPNGQKIPVCDIEIIRVWIENGALNN